VLVGAARREDLVAAEQEPSPAMAHQGRAHTHPLDPLSAEEIRRACAIVRGERQLKPTARFAAVRLCEPSKRALLRYSRGEPAERRAWVVVLDRSDRTLHDGVVSLDGNYIAEWTERPGLQGPLLLDEYDQVGELVESDPRWRQAMTRRGVLDMTQVRTDAWMIGNFGIAAHEGRRMCATLSYLREQPPDLPYARPIEGVVAYVDLNLMQVTDVLDPDPVPIPPETGRYDPEAVGALRTDLRPISIDQPDGPSFDVYGHEVRWQRWRFRWSFNAREGLVLHTVGIEDGGKLRSIAHRISMSEMVVPYGDPSPAHYWQGAFDVGDFGIGRGINSLRLGCDCVGLIQYFDVTIHDDSGEPQEIPQAICLHEEDYSVLWKHWDFVDDHTQVRRQRRLVLSCICTNLNYEYGYYWYFYLDGTIELEVKLTGVMQTKALPPGTRDRYSETVAPGLGAMHHQHLFNVRLDMAVDGPANSVHELELRAAPPGPENPWGNAMVSVATPITHESAAKRSIDAATGRSWIISNPARHNRFGNPTAYRLIPEAAPALLPAPHTPLGRRAAFARHHLWVTQFDARERFAGGEYPNQHPGGLGLPQWTAADRQLENTDVVLWHTFGISHVARPEDWPVMPVERCGFRLRPWGFFDHNPTLDVPPSIAEHCHAD
jgi:primary-amine oxidase